jgi:outer membrane receptor for ferric coprogen and ferric-rhodotorulic acid
VAPAPAPVIDDAAPMVPLDSYGAFTSMTTTSLGLPIDLKELPDTVSTLSEEFLEASQSERLRDVLTCIPGVTVNDDGGWTTDGVRIRGFSSDCYYNDGMKQVGLSIRPHFDTIERIEVLKGAAGSEFGVAEPGGVINLIRKKPFEGRLYEVDASVGSYGYQN